MLNTLIIRKLFGLYDYTLNFSSSPTDKIRFITGTNGYGKTTILKLIDAIFNRHLEVFFTIPFTELIYSLDGAILQVRQFTETSQEVEVDAADEVTVEFSFGVNQPTQKITLTKTEQKDHGISFDNVMQQIDMFFSSETCKFIDDSRLLRENSNASELVRLSELLKEKLTHPDAMTNNQIQVLKDIVKRSDFANKHLEIAPAFGFRFVADDAPKTKLAMHDLSSGEHHIMLLSLYMLFEAPEKAIILIDEPEMSFHLSWQGDYLRNLRQIVALRDVQCIIATHSPIIFDSEYNLAIDLYEQMHPEG